MTYIFPLPIWPSFLCVLHELYEGEFGLDETTSCSDLPGPDRALDEITWHFVRTRPKSGGRSLTVFLRGIRLKVHRKRV